MEVIVTSSRIVRPTYQGNPPLTTDYTPLTVFDKVTFDMHETQIFAYHSPAPPNEVFERGLQKVLSVYRECAGRLGNNEDGDPVILLNDKGARFAEASVDLPLSKIMPLELTSSLRNFHPCVVDVEELVQLQVTRFTCGSIVLGYTSHHFLYDGQSAVTFLTAWAGACRGVEKISPLPFNDRTIFTPRNPPEFLFDHANVEFTNVAKTLETNHHYYKGSAFSISDNDIVMQKFHFTSHFIAKIKEKASGSMTRYTTFVCLMAHLWKAITMSRSLPGNKTTYIKISVNGRRRLVPKLPDTYFGNMVLWAYPTAKVEDLLLQPLPYAAKIIHDAISKVNNDYFRSFIDFANYKVKQENLFPAAAADLLPLSPNIEVTNLINYPYHDLDFGGGPPFLFMPSYIPCEGLMYLVSSFTNDGGIDAFISLPKENLASFRQYCFTVDSDQVCSVHQFRSSM